MCCLINANLRSSPQAVAFTKLLQGIAFMSSFTEYGVVDLAEITYPPRANNNVEYVLVNGNPQIVYVEDGYKVDITHDSNYPALQQKYPNIQIEGGEIVLSIWNKISRWTAIYF